MEQKLKKIQAVLFLNTPSRLRPNKECFLKFGVEVGVEESIVKATPA
jgi:hypothetical protein